MLKEKNGESFEPDLKMLSYLEMFGLIPNSISAKQKGSIDSDIFVAESYETFLKQLNAAKLPEADAREFSRKRLQEFSEDSNSPETFRKFIEFLQWKAFKRNLVNELVEKFKIEKAM